MRFKLIPILMTMTACLLTCGQQAEPVKTAPPPAKPRPAILLVTLDTTRADRVGYAFPGVRTPHLDALASQGRVYTRAYATAPMTLPAHVSLFTGQYPDRHGINENARTRPPELPLLAEALQRKGYQTGAIVSAAVLDSGLGLSRGFDSYNDDVDLQSQERTAEETTRQAMEYLTSIADDSPFLWVHYYDPHHPYKAPEEFSSQYPDQPYLAEIAYMDDQLGRVLAAFQEKYGDREYYILLVGDHGESLGEHGEPHHGHLLYEGAMHVPLILVGHDIEPATLDKPVSIRRVCDTIRGWAGLEETASLLREMDEVVLAEAMKPFLHYGWSPQVMAVQDRTKVIKATAIEVYDLAADPTENKNLAGSAPLSKEMLRALAGYAVPGLETAATGELSDEQLERLASLGYAASPGLSRKEGPRPDPKDMVHLFPALDKGSDLFIEQKYEEAAPVFAYTLEQDPGNLMVCLRLAIAYSFLNQPESALEYFKRAADIAPESLDVRQQLGLHYFRGNALEAAAEQFEWVLEKVPNRPQPPEYPAADRRRQNKIFESIAPFRRAAELKRDPNTYPGLARLYQSRREPHGAAEAYEAARDILREEFRNYLDLGICYVGLMRLEEAADCFDQVPTDHPGYAQATFRRAQVAVLLKERDVRERIQFARDNSNVQTKVLIEREPLFKQFE